MNQIQVCALICISYKYLYSFSSIFSFTSIYFEKTIFIFSSDFKMDYFHILLLSCSYFDSINNFHLSFENKKHRRSGVPQTYR
jgi:hypothetical protein